MIDIQFIQINILLKRNNIGNTNYNHYYSLSTKELATYSRSLSPRPHLFPVPCQRIAFSIYILIHYIMYILYRLEETFSTSTAIYKFNPSTGLNGLASSEASDYRRFVHGSSHSNSPSSFFFTGSVIIAFVRLLFASPRRV